MTCGPEYLLLLLLLFSFGQKAIVITWYYTSELHPDIPPHLPTSQNKDNVTQAII